jgi:competence protein ComEC
VADEGDARTRARTGTRTWPLGGGRPAWSAPWPQSEFAVPARSREWAVAEAGTGRLLPWFAVAFGVGIVLYFTAEHEPALWATAPLAVGSAFAAAALRRRPVGFVVALGVFAIFAGFAVATLKTTLIAHPVLRYPASNVAISGFVELREESQKTDRFVMRVEEIAGSRIFDKPQRVRLSVRRGMAPPAGSFVELKAQLNPPLQPLAPGSYDFARDLYFQRIGASGFVRGPIRIITPPVVAGWRFATNSFVQGLRDFIDARIRSVVRGDTGSIASMLITGKRDAIDAHLYDAMFISGIGHVLSISGYHMAVIAGVVFFIIRAVLALIPGVAERAPIKKWAASAALLVTAFYLVLSGAEVATQRSFIMIAVVLIGVMLDRPTLTLRTVTIAVLIVLLFAPEAVVHPSFQMSFAATLALIAAYRHGLPLPRAGVDTSLGARAALWGINEVAGLTVASLVAGLATTPYVAYHFHRVAPFGVLANLLAMPVVSGWVMPMAFSASSPSPSASTPSAGGRWVTASTGWMRSPCGSPAFPAPSAASASSAPDRCCWRRWACCWSVFCARRCAGVAPLSQRLLSFGRCARRCPTCWSPPTAVPSPCAARVGGSPSTIAAAILLRSASGLLPMPTVATYAIAASATASSAIHPAASARSPVVGSCPTRSRRTRSQRIAAARCSS